MGRMPCYVKLGQGYKMDCGRALSLKQEASAIRYLKEHVLSK